MDSDTVSLDSSVQRIDPATHMGMLTIAIADMERSLAFYTHDLGLHRLQHIGDIALLGDLDGRVLLALHQEPGILPQPSFSTGLFHFALLLPSRAALAQAMFHFSEIQLPMGSADHLVSEALYLNDPDGNGIEVYRDRPRSEWHWQGQTVQKVQMGTDPLDVAGIMRELPMTPWNGFQSPTVLGHMHLRVGDTQGAKRFYHDIIGFDVTTSFNRAIFVSAGGYHHHIGLNMWQSHNAPPPPSNAAGVRFYTIQLPDQAALTAVTTRLTVAEVPFHAYVDGTLTRDPWKNIILFTMKPITTIDEIQTLLTDGNHLLDSE